jgi:uncharacterized LabA/DUF88 family protein/cold shock CspA family protein
MNRRNFALLIDGDNIQPSLTTSILSEIQKHGSIAIKRIYGDWTTPNMNGWKSYLQECCIRPIQQFRYGKNATDGALIMDAMEVILTNNRIDGFCIVSSDSDFYNLAIRIREAGLHIIGIGRRDTKEIFRKACNEFIFTENLSIKLDSEAQEPSDAGQLLIRAYMDCDISEEWVRLSAVGHSIKNIDSSFDPRNFNHNNLISIIKSYDEIFMVKTDDRFPPNYFIKLAKRTNLNNNGGITGTIKKWCNTFGFIENESGDFYFTKTNIEKDCRTHNITNGDKVSFSVFKQPDPKGSTTEEKNGKASEVRFFS